MSYLPRKQKLNAKKSSIEVKRERMDDFLDVVEREGEIKRIDLQLVLGLGDGQFNRIEVAVKEKYPNCIEWNKKSKTYIWIQPGITNPISQHLEEKEVTQLE